MRVIQNERADGKPGRQSLGKICFKQKRPKLVQAVNMLVDNSIRNNKSLREDSVKLYKGVE